MEVGTNANMMWHLLLICSWIKNSDGTLCSSEWCGVHCCVINCQLVKCQVLLAVITNDSCKKRVQAGVTESSAEKTCETQACNYHTAPPRPRMSAHVPLQQLEVEELNSLGLQSAPYAEEEQLLIRWLLSTQTRGFVGNKMWSHYSAQ